MNSINKNQKCMNFEELQLPFHFIICFYAEIKTKIFLNNFSKYCIPINIIKKINKQKENKKTYKHFLLENN